MIKEKKDKIVEEKLYRIINSSFSSLSLGRLFQNLGEMYMEYERKDNDDCSERWYKAKIGEIGFKLFRCNSLKEGFLTIKNSTDEEIISIEDSLSTDRLLKIEPIKQMEKIEK